MSNDNTTAFLSVEKTQPQSADAQKLPPDSVVGRRFANGVVRIGAAVILMFIIVGSLLLICFTFEPIYENEPRTLRPGDTIYFYDDLSTRRDKLVNTKQLVCYSGCDYPKKEAPTSAPSKHRSHKLMPAFTEGFCVYQGAELSHVSHSAWRCSLPTYAAPTFHVDAYRVQCEYTNISEQPDLMPAILEHSCALYYSVSPLAA